MKLTVYLCKYLGVKEDEGVYSKGGISKRPWQVPLLPVIIPELYTQQLTTISLCSYYMYMYILSYVYSQPGGVSQRYILLLPP